ncbi:MAG: hypothetical protein B7Y07_01575 [Halothiobacillus sp. 24-54-40]|nr:MAG: hypothetical protein B7Y58_01330 [Halothiobacillus sp. 35-54-62]OYZ88146.1 MAG: hypothetical protein B7Y07_01575 [Halothiobacillus sp. 24-54-40]OZA81634.1 MAG: hypothetical protein B7X64_00825 [Halothiobacillus sp. 39-53-45]
MVGLDAYRWGQLATGWRHHQSKANTHRLTARASRIQTRAFSDFAKRLRTASTPAQLFYSP